MKIYTLTSSENIKTPRVEKVEKPKKFFKKLKKSPKSKKILNAQVKNLLKLIK